MSDLERLLTMVKAATGPDRELDEDILKHLGFHSWAGRMSYRKSPIWIDFGSSEITASIDAALALVERTLPGWIVSDLCQNSRHAGDPWGCELSVYYGSDPSKNRSAFSGYDFPSAPIAILAALLTALIVQAEP